MTVCCKEVRSPFIRDTGGFGYSRNLVVAGVLRVQGAKENWALRLATDETEGKDVDSFGFFGSMI